jgi:dual specificity MAP kinase phosphatase
VDYSQITDQLFIGTTPSRLDYELLRGLGVRLIINMRFWHARPPEDGSPSLRYLHLRTFDTPLLPIPAGALVRGAEEAIDVMSRGGKIYAHCSRGRHRSVAMAAAILIAQGLSAEKAMELIKQRRRSADPAAPHIRPRIMEFARQWSGRRSSAD